MGLVHFDINMVRVQHYPCLHAWAISLQIILPWPLASCVKIEDTNLQMPQIDHMYYGSDQYFSTPRKKKANNPDLKINK